MSFAYNINADVVAGKMAEVLKAEKLVMLTNTPGVLDKEGNLITGLTSKEIDALFGRRYHFRRHVSENLFRFGSCKNGVKSRTYH